MGWCKFFWRLVWWLKQEASTSPSVLPLKGAETTFSKIDNRKTKTVLKAFFIFKSDICKNHPQYQTVLICLIRCLTLTGMFFFFFKSDVFNRYVFLPPQIRCLTGMLPSATPWKPSLSALLAGGVFSSLLHFSLYFLSSHFSRCTLYFPLCSLTFHFWKLVCSCNFAPFTFHFHFSFCTFHFALCTFGRCLFITLHFALLKIGVFL